MQNKPVYFLLFLPLVWGIADKLIYLTSCFFLPQINLEVPATGSYKQNAISFIDISCATIGQNIQLCCQDTTTVHCASIAGIVSHSRLLLLLMINDMG